MPDSAPIRVVFVLLERTLALDWAGPAEALRIANQLCVASGQPAPFALEFVSPQPDAVSSVGVTLSGLAPLPVDLADGAAAAWVVLLGQRGERIDVSGADTQAVLHWLRALPLAAGRIELMTICAGTLLAAHAGVLAGRRATTHHHHLDELRAVAPDCEVVSNRVFVLDPPLYSSAGVTTGIDLVLHRIAQTCGEPLAAQVAQSMVVALRRGPHDPELSPFLAYRNHLHPALHRVQDAISKRPGLEWDVPRMAAVAHASPRHLTRLFVDHAGIAPLGYLRRIRLASAQLALASGANVTQAAEASGFGSDTQLRRAWRQFGLAGSPSVGRQAIN